MNAIPPKKQDRGTYGRKGPVPGFSYTSSAEKYIKKRRQGHVEGGKVVYVGTERATRGPRGTRRYRFAVVGFHPSIRSLDRSPSGGIAKAIRDALDPTKAPSKGRTLADMTDEEKAIIEAKYGKIRK